LADLLVEAEARCEVILAVVAAATGVTAFTPFLVSVTSPRCATGHGSRGIWELHSTSSRSETLVATGSTGGGEGVGTAGLGAMAWGTGHVALTGIAVIVAAVEVLTLLLFAAFTNETALGTAVVRTDSLSATGESESVTG